MIIYRGASEVVSVEEKFENDGGYTDAQGQTVIRRRSLGWFIRITNSAAIAVGDVEPPVKAGDRIVVTVETPDWRF